MYKISINTTPDVFNDKPMYFCMIAEKHGENEHNCGHGWYDSIAKAAEDANKYYQEKC